MAVSLLALGRNGRNAYSAKRLISTVSAKEISHFSRLSEQWWDENGEFKYLHRMNPSRIAFLKQRLLHTEEYEVNNFEGNQWLKGRKVLDVGCGGGLFAEALARVGGRVTGVDASESNIDIARLHASQDPFLSEAGPSNVTYRVARVEALAEKEAEQYDVVTSMEVLEHVSNPNFFLRSLLRLLKPNGHLILSTISRTPLSQLLTISIAENRFFGSVAPGTHTYNQFVKPEELRRFFEEVYPDRSLTRSSDLEFRGVIYDPFNGRWVLKNSASAYLLCNYYVGFRKPGQ
ncbi:ubiquinone biosynthesis O-methyltransferase [Atractiella rhizophila]|nr:ubiquinone biosynthesis O-methyltransferase [Atractiella rhizophila]